MLLQPVDRIQRAVIHDRYPPNYEFNFTVPKSVSRTRRSELPLSPPHTSSVPTTEIHLPPSAKFDMSGKKLSKFGQALVAGLRKSRKGVPTAPAIKAGVSFAPKKGGVVTPLMLLQTKQHMGKIKSSRAMAAARAGGSSGGPIFSAVRDPIGNKGFTFRNNQRSTSVRVPMTWEKLGGTFGGDVIGSTAFSINSIYLNPGNKALMPKLSALARLFKIYRFNRLVLKYETESFAASGSAVSAGKVIAAVSPDSNQAPFANDTEMENFPGAVRSAPFQSFTVDLAPLLRSRPLSRQYVFYSNNAAAPSGSVDEFYDAGLLFLAVQATQAGELGEWYIGYDVTLTDFCSLPQYPSNIGGSWYSSPAASSANTAWGGSTGWATVASTGVTGFYPTNISNGFNMQLIQTGWYLVVMALSASNLSAAQTINLALGSNLAGLYLPNHGAANGWYDTVTSSGSTFIGFIQVTADGTGANNTFTVTDTSARTFSSSDISICVVQMPIPLGSASAASFPTVSSAGPYVQKANKEVSALELALSMALKRLAQLETRVSARAKTQVDCDEEEDKHPPPSPFQVLHTEEPLDEEDIIQALLRRKNRKQPSLSLAQL